MGSLKRRFTRKAKKNGKLRVSRMTQLVSQASRRTQTLSTRSEAEKASNTMGGSKP